MTRSLDSLEDLLLFYGAARPPDRANKGGIRLAIEDFFGQLIGFLVATWIILRSIDSVFSKPAPPRSPTSREAVESYVPTPVRAHKQRDANAQGKNHLRGNLSSMQRKMSGATTFTCRIVDIRGTNVESKQRQHQQVPVEIVVEVGVKTSTVKVGNEDSEPDSNGKVVGVVVRSAGECETLFRRYLSPATSGLIMDEPTQHLCRQALQALSSELSTPAASSKVRLGPPVEAALVGLLSLSASQSSLPPASLAAFLALPKQPAASSATGLKAAVTSAGAAAGQPGAALSPTTDSSGHRDTPSLASSESESGLESAETASPGRGKDDAQPEPGGAISSGRSDGTSGGGGSAGRYDASEMSGDTDEELAGSSEDDDDDEEEEEEEEEDSEFDSDNGGLGEDGRAAGAGGGASEAVGGADALVGGSAAATSAAASLSLGKQDGLAAGAGDDASAAAVKQLVTIPLPPKSEWPDYPILVRCSEDTPMEIDMPEVAGGAYGALPINDAARPIPFETNLFKGVAMIRIADLKTTPLDYFAGKRRRMQVCVQGKFKRPMRFDEVYGGQEFVGGLRNIPGKWMIKWAFELLKPRLPKSFQADLFGPLPYFLSPLVLTAQKMRADPEGVEGGPQPVTDHDILEEMGPILGEKYRGKNDDRGRKKVFSSQQALRDTVFDTTTTYTFDYFQQFLRSDQFALDLGVKLLDLHYYLGEQPLLLTMAKSIDTGEYLWKFELWHERCVPGDTSAPP